MTKEEKKLQTKTILDNIYNTIENAIDIDMDSDLFPYELITEAITICIDMSIMGAAKLFEDQYSNGQKPDKMVMLAAVNKFMVEAKHERKVSKEEALQFIDKIKGIKKQEVKEEKKTVPTTGIRSQYDN